MVFFTSIMHVGLTMVKTWNDMKYWDSDEFINNIKELNKSDTIPHVHLWLRAFDLTPLNETRVVILGQDPYPTLGHAHGLAFSVPKSVTSFPPSLRNIFRELVSDLGCDWSPPHGDLSQWAKQGVLLLNTSLTTVVGQPGAHKHRWDGLITSVFRTLKQLETPIVFVLWGQHAQSIYNKQWLPLQYSKTRLDSAVSKGHALCNALATSHPSPFAAQISFFGSKPFSWVNTHLDKPIDWKIT